MLKYIFKLYKNYFWWVILFSFITIFNGALTILIPYGQKLIIDSFLGIPTIISIEIIFTILISIIFIRSTVWYFYRLVADIIGSNIELELRLKIFKHLQKLPSSFFKNKESGDITSTIINDISGIKDISQDIPEEMLWTISIFSGVMIVSFLTNINMFYLMVTIFIINAFFIYLTSKGMKNVFKKIRDQRAKMNQQALNNFHGIHESRAFNNEKFDYKRFYKVSKKYRKSWWSATKKIGIHDMVGSISFHGSTLVILIFGYYLVTIGDLSVSNFILFAMYTGYLIDPIFRVRNFVKVWKQARSSYERIQKITNTLPQKNEGKLILKTFSNAIEFKNVSIAFGKNVVLEKISFKIPFSKKIAFVGQTGGGKTTIINTILRFIDDYKGKVFIDGEDIKKYDIFSFRNQLGLIQQQPFIFPGSLFNNVKYGNIKASKEEVIKAIKKAELWDFVKTHKKGINTIVGENGIKLSGGQRQRVAIARVILKNPNIIIMDEATSALDTATERKIQKALDNLMENRTSIIIAHRLKTIVSCDEILIVGNKKILARGTHEQLLENSEIYKNLQGV